MTREYKVTVEGKIHTVVASDDREALLAAKAAGKASVELWKKGQGMFLTRYVVESLEDLTKEYLEQVVRRELGLPWEILRTRRLVIREFKLGDEACVPADPEDGEADGTFRDRRRLEEYIRCQYGFYGYGIWAVIQRHGGVMVGKAGVTNVRWESEGGQDTGEALELGYHIFTPYRGRGYAREACEGILEWCKEQGISPSVYAKTDSRNQKSVNLLKKLGFCLTDQRCSGSGQKQFLFVGNCR